MTSPLNDARLEAMLERLHAQSEAQETETRAYFSKRLKGRDTAQKKGSDRDWERPMFDDDMHRFFADKMVSLERDKAECCYLLCRSLRAARVVEAGTSFGVSTLYLAAAVRDNQVTNGVVIGTEFEPKKAEAARSNFKDAGLESFIELREGDLRETLKEIDGPVDFMLIDIWDVALPALDLVAPRLRPGAIVVADNTHSSADYYRDYFEFVHDPANRLATMTLPFQGGFELTVRI